MERDNSEAASGSVTTTTTTTTGSSPSGASVHSMFTCTQTNPTPSINHLSERPSVQVMQQAIPKPACVTTQYLQQVFTAQQHHIMVQTTSVHQHPQPTALTTHSSASGQQQVSQSNSRQCTSPPPVSNGNAVQTSPPPVSNGNALQTSITSQPVRQFQATSSSDSAGAVSQHAMLLGNSSPPGSQAQMYLRTQMLILAPAASVSADLPALTSVCSQPGYTQGSSLSMRTHLPGALTAAPSVQLKVTSQDQSLPKMSLCPLKSTHLSQALVETSSTLTPLQSHTMVQQLHCTPSLKAAPPQLVLQSSTTRRQVQPIALRVTPQDRGPPPLSLMTRTTPSPAAVLSQHCEVLSVPTPSDQPTNQTSIQQQTAVMSTSTLPPGCPALLDPPPLHLGPGVEPLPQSLPLNCPPPLTLALPKLAVPPASLQRLSLHSVRALAMQYDHRLVSDSEPPGTDALVQLPFQNLPPPQTVAVDLKVQPTPQIQDPSQAEAVQLLKEGLHVDQVREEPYIIPPKSRSPTPPALSPVEELRSPCSASLTQPDCTGTVKHSCLQCSGSVVQPPEDSALSITPPPLLCAAVRSSSHPASPEGQPSQATVRPHILTHLIEGFVIREGLEPFPVGRTSPENQKQPGLPQDNPGCYHDFLLDTEQPDSDIDNSTIEDERHVMENLPDVLQCEFCGKKNYAHTFLRSKRFCSMTCVRRFNVSCTKRLSILGAQRVNRWPNRRISRRGRPPSRVNRNSQNNFLTQLHGSYRPNSLSQRAGEECEEISPGPMTTRLHLQANRERNQEQGTWDSCTSSTCLSESSPACWSVEQVCCYISSLPGCQDMVVEFRSQEIDGQALLLLTEEHLMSVMNIKLGPALKICARINSLKEP